MAEIRKANGFIDWLDQRIAIKTLTKVLMTEYWIPKNINFLWAMGVVCLVLFGMLFVSGLFLLMYYKPDANLAFDSVNYTIMTEVAYGWLWRNIHAVSASMVFVVIYIHMFVGIYYGSYKRGREVIWISGMLLFVLFSAEAFSGYMLPWGQMSYWAAVVITNLFGGIPFIGPDIVEWVRGDYSVADATLTRFFMLHVCLIPILIIAVIAIHFYTLRVPHVNNQEGEHLDFEAEAKKYLEGKRKESKVIPFWPVFLSKDIFVIFVFLTLFFFLACFNFDFALDPINFDPANNLKTPLHIYPEWYFLWSYEVLRGFFFSSEFGLAMFGLANVIFFALPFLDRSPVVAPAHKRPVFLVWFIILLIDMIVLTIFGKLPPDMGINKWIGLGASTIFIALFVILPFITKNERVGGSH
ncbi:cytochrome bc complex cytochrome b subunit [Helicobacter cholecystus]|uniref:Cytochrome bc complex cytochrome b subunit n=1 Tax=Helicobacter cholecystus TaxID=45498 RepID=A0A3D8IVT9_9HELI|nr:cytochrome bc complex cytochrome b subunit [Helicobacter cholecystus]RDU69110.1 cytochrome bc complex cytochrome b subunit [Helicobacter cholecystus]VEJ24641.1 ubiquinol cytochrome c oxidoreductase [Helicobacter cholecystus]